jgi:hypothetical protein
MINNFLILIYWKLGLHGLAFNTFFLLFFLYVFMSFKIQGENIKLKNVKVIFPKFRKVVFYWGMYDLIIIFGFLASALKLV